MIEKKKYLRHVEGNTQAFAEFRTNPGAHMQAGLLQTETHPVTSNLLQVLRQPSFPHGVKTSLAPGHVIATKVEFKYNFLHDNNDLIRNLNPYDKSQAKRKLLPRS